MYNPRVASIRAANRTTKGLKVLFGQMGSAQHPRGKILRAYRNVRRGAKSAFEERNPQFALHEVLRGFQAEMSDGVNELLLSARALGRVQAAVEIEVWELAEVRTLPRSLKTERDGWLALVTAQVAATEASLTPGYVFGGETQAGVLQPGPVIQAGAHWLAAAALGGWLLGTERSIEIDRRGFEWYKQAVPMFDERTTDCCLRVAGQAVPMNSQFHLTGTPRYADWQDWVPFHGFCRTSVVLVPKQFVADDLTQRIRNDAQKQMLIRHNAQVEARDIIQKLVDLGTPSDSRRRKDDTKKIVSLRRRLLELRQLTGYDLGDS